MFSTFICFSYMCSLMSLFILVSVLYLIFMEMSHFTNCKLANLNGKQFKELSRNLWFVVGL